jgi:hypothetical protein
MGFKLSQIIAGFVLEKQAEGLTPSNEDYANAWGLLNTRQKPD